VAWAVDTRPRADAVDRWPAAACWILGLCIGAFLKTPVTITLGDALLECHRNSGPTAAGDNEYALEQKYSLSFSVSRLCRSRATYQKDPQPGEHRQRDAIQRGGELTPCTTCMSRQNRCPLPTRPSCALYRRTSSGREAAWAPGWRPSDPSQAPPPRTPVPAADSYSVRLR